MDVVIGAAFGDEGKGLITHYLASQYGSNCLVVRFNGGAQAGHTVITADARRHVFRHFGSGTFIGAPTFLSQYFVSNPALFLAEQKELNALGQTPKVYVDPDSLITTPYDMMINQIVEEFRADQKHGSCGVGFAETIERNLHQRFSLKTADLENTDKIKHCLQLIRKEWLPQRLQALNIYSLSEDWKKFITSEDIFQYYLSQILSFLENITISRLDLHHATQPLIFEGAQGLMLDQTNGWFPHVTRSHTGLKNVMNLLNNHCDQNLNVIYVTRSYLTRHGAGPLPHELTTLPYKKIIDQTNITNPHQGALRFAWFNLSLLESFIQADLQNLPTTIDGKHKLAITCLDQVEKEITYIENGITTCSSQEAFLHTLTQQLPISSLLCSYGPTREDIKAWKSHMD